MEEGGGPLLLRHVDTYNLKNLYQISTFFNFHSLSYISRPYFSIEPLHKIFGGKFELFKNKKKEKGKRHFTNSKEDGCRTRSKPFLLSRVPPMATTVVCGGEEEDGGEQRKFLPGYHSNASLVVNPKGGSVRGIGKRRACK